MDLILDHFHVHIVNVNFEGGILGMTVGQAHLLDDVISLVSYHSAYMNTTDISDEATTRVAEWPKYFSENDSNLWTG